MKQLLSFLAICIFTEVAFAQVNWSENIAPIIYGNCSKCHNPNGIAPISLMSYSDAYSNGVDIRDYVESREMPPWPPDPHYSRFANERILTQEQIDNISQWVYDGMPRGDSMLEPLPPVFSTVSEIANPDLVLNAPVYNVNTSSDLYRCFVVPSTLVTDQYITGFEVIPGNRNIVHHVLIYSDTSNIPVNLDAADPGPGYTNVGGTGSPYAKLIGIWVPGQQAYFTPQGMGIRLPANSHVVMQVHYPGGISNEVDSTKFFLKLTSNFQREVTIDSPLNHFDLDNGPLFILPNTTKTFYAHYVVPIDFSVLAVGPHMHLIGTSIKSWGITPMNDTIPFIDIPHWDFHWQGSYSFPRVLKIPMNTTLYSEARYDNTSSNNHNPNNPPQLVTLGEATTDEMMLVYFSFTPYFPGDENIIIDSTITNIAPLSSSVITTPQLYDPLPNPTTGAMTVQFFLPKPSDAKVLVLNMQGKILHEEKFAFDKGGLVTSTLHLENLASGVYFITLQAGETVRTKKIVKE